MASRKTLRYGSRGPDVVELQTRLNLSQPTALAPLVPDGVFGAKTLARVKEFQRNNGLGVDGIVGPQTWGKLLGSTPTTPPTLPPTSLGLTRKQIIQHAKAQVGKIDYSQRLGPHQDPLGWDHLGTIFEKGAGLKLSDAELKQTWRPRNKDWCGIFCVYCYQLAGKKVTWNLNGTGPQGAIKKWWPWDFPSRTAFEAAIQPGDIAATAEKAHHYIVVSPNPATGRTESVDGNQEFGRIRNLTTRTLSKIVAFYSPK
jgi:peptidoglycan hydrolase-like protein with peptidoglycan-binding domain